MIYTVTFNPAIDYVVRMDGDLLPGMTNRSSSEEYYFGGKGINVSMVLSELGLKSTALGFIAGFTGNAINDGVNRQLQNNETIQIQYRRQGNQGYRGSPGGRQAGRDRQ